MARQHQYAVTPSDPLIETYTFEEAIAIARQIALETGQERLVTDGAHKPKARVFVYQGQAYADYYLTERVVQCDIICHGKPRLAGGRIMVHLILDLLAAGVPVDDITGPAYYPDLTRADILACIEYASSVLKAV
jgi:uncharacterized protein (DUF433 family)